MSDQTIFNQQTTVESSNDAAANASTVQNNNQSFADLLVSIANERGEPKYRDIPTALQALKHSQEFIPQLKEEKEKAEREAATLRAEVERLRNVEKSVEQLTQQNNQVQNTPVNVITEEVVANLIQKTITDKEKATVKANNTRFVTDQMQKAFGDKAEQEFYSKASELGLSANQINQLAGESPTAVLKLFGFDGKQSNQNASVNHSSVNTTALQPTHTSYIGRNTNIPLVGSTSQDLLEEHNNSKKLVEELHAKGMSVNDLTDPKNYFKLFGNKG